MEVMRPQTQDQQREGAPHELASSSVGLTAEPGLLILRPRSTPSQEKQVVTLWQERVERLGEPQGRLAGMAQEIAQLKAQAGAQAGRIDELRAENLRLGQEAEAFSMERDQLRAVIARIGELVRQATEARPSVAGEATPAAGPGWRPPHTPPPARKPHQPPPTPTHVRP